MHDHDAASHQDTNPDRYDQPFWEERYRSQPAIWSGRPNTVLVAEIADVPAGTALDVGCGEGGDAIWLAQQGWTVTAVDFSTVALERGQARATSLDLGDRIRWVHADLNHWRPDAGEHPAGHVYDSVLKAVRTSARVPTGSS